MGIYLATLTIAEAGTDSADITASLSARALRTLKSIEIHGPAALTGTVTVETPNSIGSSPTYNTLQSGGADVTVGADKVTIITAVPMHGFRVHSSSAEGAARSFVVMGEEKD